MTGLSRNTALSSFFGFPSLFLFGYNMSVMRLTLSYLILCLGAEIMTARGLLIPAALLYGLVILTAFGWYGVRRLPSGPRLPLGFGLVALMRFFSLTLPLGLLAPIARHAVVAVPLWVAMWLLARRLDLSAQSLGLSWREATLQAWIAFNGLPLGLAGYFILRPQALMPDARAWELALGALVLFASVALTEELLFRGFLLILAEQELGYAGILLSSLLFATLYLGTGSLLFALFMGLVGWGFSETARRTGSIWGIIFAHALMIVGMGVLWPLVLPFN